MSSDEVTKTRFLGEIEAISRYLGQKNATWARKKASVAFFCEEFSGAEASTESSAENVDMFEGAQVDDFTCTV